MRNFFLTQARTARTTTFRHRLTPALLAIALAGAAAGHSAAAADRPNETAVTRWNVIATNAFTPSQGTNPMAQSRTLAILHAAIHDALNAIEPRFQMYSPGLGRATGASAEAAVAAAARDVLVTLLPAQAALVESEYARALAAIPDGPAKSAGVALGQASARVNITRRQADGADKAAQPYVPRTGPGEYQFTPPFDFAGQPGWGQVTPFVIDIREHTVAGPLDRSSPKYARDLAQVEAIGEINSAIRTREQSEIAQFWYETRRLGGTESRTLQCVSESSISGQRREHLPWSTSPWRMDSLRVSKPSIGSDSGAPRPRSALLPRVKTASRPKRTGVPS